MIGKLRTFVNDKLTSKEEDDPHYDMTNNVDDRNMSM